MSEQTPAERIAQLQARGQAQRLAAQLAILEAREQLAPLRSAYSAVGAAARLLSPGRPASNVLGAWVRFGISHPWLSSVISAAALRTARRRPLPLALAVGIGALAWWLMRAPTTDWQQDDR